MEARIVKQTKESCLIKWEDGVWFGEVTMNWDSEKGKLIVDTELLSIETFIKIIKSL
jgi:hypothetical protein